MLSVNPRGRLDRTSVVDAALAIADQDGLDGVSMRAVAAGVGSAPMSLYRYVPSKEALLDAMLDRVLERLTRAPAKRDGWRHQLGAVARQARSLLLAHPAWMPLFARSNTPRLALLQCEQLAVNIATEERVSRQTAISALSSVSAFTLGSVLVEQAMRSAIPPRQAPLAQTESFDKVFRSGTALLASRSSARPSTCREKSGPACNPSPRHVARRLRTSFAGMRNQWPTHRRPHD